jgi:hypothetical protein
LLARDAFFKALRFFWQEIKELEINQLPWQFFLSGSPLETSLLLSTTFNLKRLVIALYNSSARVSNYMDLCAELKRHLLQRFLGTLRNLVELSISIPIPRGNNGRYDEAVDLSDVLPSNITKLQWLRLEHFETCKDFFESTLRNNAATLKVLDLRDMYLNPSGSWVDIFTTYRNHQQKLQWARLSGEFCDSVNLDLYLLSRRTPVLGTEDGWNFDQATTIARALENYLVSGGTCPLRD